MLVALAGVAVATGLPQRIDRERRVSSQGAILPGRRPERHGTAAFLAAGGTLLLHAGIGRPSAVPGRLTRLVAGLACLALALTPALVLASQGPLNRSVKAFKRGDCAKAIDGALDSLEVLGSRPDPFEILG